MGFGQLRAAGIVAMALAPPGIAVFRHLGRGLRLTERVLIGLALAPFALGVPALAFARLAHLPVARCLWPAEFIWMVAAAWPRRAGSSTEPLPERGQGFPAIAAVVTALGAGALIAAVTLSGELVLVSGDAWPHAAAITEIARRGVPPQDPSFAGIALYEPWFLHFLIALLGTKTRILPFERLALVDAWAAVVLVLAVAQVSYRVFGRAAAMWAGAIAVLGLDPFGWLFTIGRLLQRSGSGFADTIAGLGTERGAATTLAFGFPPSHVSMLGRLWNSSTVVPAIALCMAVAWSVARALERPSRLASVRMLVLACAALAFEPTVAAMVFAALGAGLAIAALTGARPRRGTALLVLTAVILVAAIAAVRACGPSGTLPSPGLGFRPGDLWSLALSVGPWWVIAFPALATIHGGGATLRCCATTALVLSAATVTVARPAFESDALFFLAWASLVPLLAAGWVLWADRLRLKTSMRAAVFGALVVPTSALYTLGTALDPRSPRIVIQGESVKSLSLPLVTKVEREGYEYLRDNLPEDAVVIEKQRPTRNEPVAVFAGRRVFCGSLDAQLADRFGEGPKGGRHLTALREEYKVRREVQDALFESNQLDPTMRQYLAGFSAPIYLLARHSELPDSIWYGLMDRDEWKSEFSNDEMQICRFDPQSVPGDAP